jgi:hypothetical protein
MDFFVMQFNKKYYINAMENLSNSCSPNFYQEFPVNLEIHSDKDGPYSEIKPGKPAALLKITLEM